MLQLKIPWEEVKEKIKETNVDLTDADLIYNIGREKELLERLARKMNKGPEEIKAWIESVSGNEGKAS